MKLVGEPGEAGSVMATAVIMRQRFLARKSPQESKKERQRVSEREREREREPREGVIILGKRYQRGPTFAEDGGSSRTELSRLFVMFHKFLIFSFLCVLRKQRPLGIAARAQREARTKLGWVINHPNALHETRKKNMQAPPMTHKMIPSCPP